MASPYNERSRGGQGIFVLRSGRRGIRRETPYTQGGRQGLSARDRIDGGAVRLPYLDTV